MDRRIFTRSIAKEIGMVLASILGIIISYGFVLTVLNWALQYQWLFPIVTIPWIGLLVFLGLEDLKSREARFFPIRKGLTIFSLMILIAGVGFAAISFWLESVGWAEYTPGKLELYSYNNYYLWQFLDMIPLLNVNDTLGFTAPLQPVGIAAGLPILMFRILVFYGLLKALKSWWGDRFKI